MNLDWLKVFELSNAKLAKLKLDYCFYGIYDFNLFKVFMSHWCQIKKIKLESFKKT